MREVIKKISYLRGLCNGYGFDRNTKEGTVLLGMLDVLDDMADAIDNLSLCTGCEDSDENEEEYSYAFICPNCGQELEVDEEILNSEEELTCPACGNIIPVLNEFADFDDDEE